MDQTAVSDSQSSPVTLNELVEKARKIYCNFEFQRRSHIEISQVRPVPMSSNTFLKQKVASRTGGYLVCNQKANHTLKTKRGNK